MAKKWLLAGLVLVLGMVFLKEPILRGMAHFLVAPEKIVSSDVIIVLGGEKEGERTERSVQLFQQGVAPRLLFSDGTRLSWRIMAADEMVALAKKKGIPTDALFKEEKSRSTYENAIFSKEFMETHGWKSAMIVTTYWHTARSKYIFDKVFEGSGIQLNYAQAADKSCPNLDHWWGDSEKQQVVLTEWAKFIVYR